MEEGFLSRFRKLFEGLTGNFLILALSWLLMDFSREIAETYRQLYILALGGTGFTLGLFSAGLRLATGVVYPLGGLIADRYGRRKLVVTMSFLLSLTYLLYALAPSWEWIVAGAVLTGLATIHSPALYAMIADSLPPEKRGLGFSLITTITGVATTPAPMVAAFLFDRLGLIKAMRTAYLIVVFFCLAASLIRLRLTETLPSSESFDVRSLLRSYPESLKALLDVWRRLPSPLVYLLVVDLLATSAFFIADSFIVVFLVDYRRVLDEPLWAVVYTLSALSAVASSIPVGRLIDRVGRRKPLLTSLPLLISSFPVLLYGDAFLTSLTVCLWIPLWIAVFTSIESLEADLTPRKFRGRFSASRGLATLVFGAAACLLGGVLYEVSPNLAFTAPPLILSSALPFLWVKVKEPEVREV